LHPGWVEFGNDWIEFERNKATNNEAGQRAALVTLIRQARGEVPPWFRWEIITGNVLGIQATHDTPAATVETLSIRAEKGILEPYDWLILNSELEPVRKQPQFSQIAMRSRTEFERMISTLEAARGRNELPSYLEKQLGEMTNLLKPNSSLR
jgi:hypothetical protein